jgi:hypothetical protein
MLLAHRPGWISQPLYCHLHSINNHHQTGSSGGSQADNVTADNLTWRDYNQVPVPKIKGKDAYTAWNRNWHYESIQYDPSGYQDSSGQWIGLAAAWFKGIRVSVPFDSHGSWVVRGKQSPELFAHESLHLRIAEYIGKQAEKRLSELVAYGEGFNRNKDLAIKDAEEQAKQHLLAMKVEWFKQWVSLDNTITTIHSGRATTKEPRKGGETPPGRDAPGILRARWFSSSWQAGIHAGFFVVGQPAGSSALP